MMKADKKLMLKCRECGEEYPPTVNYVCRECFGPLDVTYDYDSLRLRKDFFSNRPKNLWRYLELLPICDPSKIVDLGAGLTPLHKSDRLAKLLGLRDLFLKNDTVNPTFSFKDRPASVGVSKAIEFGIKTVGCASTGNLAAAVAAHAARAGLPSYVFIPADTEPNKVIQAQLYGANLVAVDGTYDEINRLCTQIAEIYGWGFVNINLRPYYVEGSKTLAYEVCEQLGWEPPDHVIVPTASGAMLCAISKGFKELRRVGLIEERGIRISAAQPEGCAPIVSAFRSNSSEIVPVERPQTIAKSLAIGDPGDGFYALKEVRESKGVAESATDEEIVNGIKLLAETEGIFTEPAGGVAVAVLKKLVDQGRIDANERVVCYITGNGLKTSEAVSTFAPRLIRIKPELSSFLSRVGGMAA
jgi:threonine synthase